MKTTEYSVTEINQVIEAMSRLYDIVRLVDAEECRTIMVDEHGNLHYGSECFNVWSADQRCANCSSFQACRTNTSRDKVELFQGKRYQIQSIPISLRLLNATLWSCVMELIKIEEASVPFGNEHDDTVTVDYEYLIDHDELTRLYNMHALNKSIRATIMDHPDTDYLLVCGDISNFKLVNTLFGREKGNEILLGIADVLRQSCTEREVYGRIRGDQFLMLIPKECYHEVDFERGIQQIRGMIQSSRFTLRMHLGVYEITDRNMSIPVMIDRAVIARRTLHETSEHSIAYYTEEMLARQIQEQKVVSEFESALGTQQLRIFLQPQVDIYGHPEGAEALVRWILPNGKMAMPVEFIEVLERSDLICKLDQAVWEMTVMQLAKWKGTPFERLHLSVNVSPKDFYYIDVPNVLDSLCHRYAVSTKKLRVELTETVLADKRCDPVHIVERLQHLGFYVEIDDFGKGFSSLSLLKDIKADTLKVDMEFIRETKNMERSKIILRAIAGMARELGMQTVVEGVETQEQIDWLSSCGYVVFQGFYFSRPISVEEFEAKYKEIW